MMNIIMLVVVSIAVLGLVSCEPHRSNTTLIETVIEIADEARKTAVHKVENISDVLTDMGAIADDARKAIVNETENISGRITDMGVKIKDAMEEMLDEDFDDDTTEFLGVDVNGCNRGLRKQLEDKCDLEYDRVNDEAQLIEDERQKTEAVCCALEDFEKCSLRAYDKADCTTDKAAIRENLKAARLFLSVVANITCTEFRGQCAFYSSGVADSTVGYTALIVSAVTSLVSFLV